MGWNPSPQVAAARDFGKRFGADRVIIFFATKDDHFGFASYGETPKLCRQTSRAASRVYQQVGEAIAAETGGGHE